MHEKDTLIVRIVFRYRAGDPVVLRLAALEVATGRSDGHDPHVPFPHGTPLAVADLEVHGVGVQGVGRGEIAQDSQGGHVDAPGQMLVVGVFGVELDLVDAGVSGYVLGDGDAEV